jgi:hypothetical protein
MTSFSPFTITDSATPLVVELSPGHERTSLSSDDEHPAYVYDGPFGPVFGTYDAALTRTRWWGPEVPDTTLDTGPELIEEPGRTTRELRDGIGGSVGELSLALRRTCDRDTTTTREIAAELGPGRYVLRAAGLLPRVALLRPDGEVVASYTLRGRRPHGLADDATPPEAVLALVLVPFASRLAYTG